MRTGNHKHSQCSPPSLCLWAGLLKKFLTDFNYTSWKGGAWPKEETITFSKWLISQMVLILVLDWKNPVHPRQGVQHKTKRTYLMKQFIYPAVWVQAGLSLTCRMVLKLCCRNRQTDSRHTEGDEGHDEDLGSWTKENRQQHSLPGRSENISMDQLPPKLLLGILLEAQET